MYCKNIEKISTFIYYLPLKYIYALDFRNHYSRGSQREQAILPLHFSVSVCTLQVMEVKIASANHEYLRVSTKSALTSEETRANIKESCTTINGQCALFSS